MAFAARHLLMRAHQLESRGAVVKFGFMPALVLMAALTTAFLHTLGKLSGVGIADNTKSATPADGPAVWRV